MVYLSKSSDKSEKIIVENGKIVSIFYEYNKKVYEMQREETYDFDSLLTKIMTYMMKDNLSLFKDMLKEIRNSDLDFFNKGKKMLDKEKEKYEL